MTEPVFFTLEGDFRGFVQDAAGDGNYQPENVAISATVTITPLLNGIVRATSASPRPISYLAAPTVAIVDPADGRLKIRSAGEAGNPDGFSFTPVRLLANSEYLELDPATPLWYRLTFTSVTFGGVRGNIPSWDVEAPSTDVTINVVESAPQTGAIANGVTKIAPGGVRFDGDNIVFTFGGVDLADPIPASTFAGPTGPTGPGATIDIGTVSTGNAGSSASVTNVGTSGAAVLDFTIPKGDTGSTGSTGAAATISVGTVTTGNAGSSASVTNVGTSGAATFDFTIPRGDKGDTGNTGSTGSTGSAATISVGTVTTGSAGSSATVTNVGTSGAATFDFTIPRGDTGNTGSTGSTGSAATISVGTVTTGSPGSSATVTNVGTSGAAVFDITIPRGDVGSADPSTWTTIDGKPAVVAEGATKADARSSIDAEYTGNKGTANGYASLDSAGKVPYTQLPASIMSYLGTWNATTNSPSLADGTGDAGDLYRVATAGSQNLGAGSITYGVGDYVIYNGSTWEKSDSTDAVASVNGYTGVISLTKSDVGLGAVDNTADTDKPVSTATSTALGGKEPTISAGSAGEYWTGSKTWATLNAAAVSGAEATANKGAAGGYAGLDSGSKVAIGNLPTGTTSTTVCIGDDSRLSDARTPTSHTHAVADINASTSTALGVGSVELGHATDTTLTRSAAGKLAVEGVDVLLNGGALGTPSSGTLTSCTGLPVAGITASTATALGLGSIELGHATDTTVARSAAGQITVEGKAVLTEDNTVTVSGKTLTNPTITSYVESVVAVGTVTSSNTIALTSGTVQTATLTASTACTFTMPTATAGKSFVLLLKQAASTGDGTATFTGVKWGTAGAPTITATAGKMDILTFVSDGNSWFGSVAQGFTP